MLLKRKQKVEKSGELKISLGCMLFYIVCGGIGLYLEGIKAALLCWILVVIFGTAVIHLYRKYGR